MKHTSRSYFVERVIPSYETFVNYYNNREFGLRKDTFNAGNIAESLRDTPEHIFLEIGTATGYKNANEFRSTVSVKHQYYKIVCDLANAIKHREITRNNPTFSSLDDIKESVAIVRYEDIFGRYFKTRKLLEVNLLDCSVHDIGDLLNESITLWSNQLINLGLIPSKPKLSELPPKLIRRKDSRFDEVFIMFANVGESVNHQLRNLIYRPNSNSVTECKPGEKFGNGKAKFTYKIDASPFEKI